MPNETAETARRSLTFMSRLSSLVLVVAWLGTGCSSTDPAEMGAGGRGGTGGAMGGMSGARAGAGGATAGAGGATCGRLEFMHDLEGECLPPSSSTFSCKPTYDEQAAVTSCSGLGSLTIDKGEGGSGWAWQCMTGVTNWICIYDGTKNLVKARSCSENACDISSDLSTDGGRACDISELHGG